MNQAVEKLRAMATAILDLDNAVHTLRPEVVEMATIFTDAQTVRPASQQDISGGETRTSNGLAISPTMAAMCVDDFARTATFIRGTYAAIVDARNRFPDRPVRVLYAGCGPFATLAVPLMAVFSCSEVTFTLLDIHSESIESARSIIDTLCLSDSVASYEVQDARSYRVCSDRPPDIILVETMQACLESEPQVSITRHLLSQAPDAILVPEEVRIDLKLVDPDREFILDGLEHNEHDTHRDRLPVGPVFTVNRTSVTSWKSISGSYLPGATVRIPDPAEQRYRFMLFTEIRVYRKQVLKDYDCGLTYPRALSTDEAVEAGETIRFFYELGSRPGLRNRVCD